MPCTVSGSEEGQPRLKGKRSFQGDKIQVCDPQWNNVSGIENQKWGKILMSPHKLIAPFPVPVQWFCSVDPRPDPLFQRQYLSFCLFWGSHPSVFMIYSQLHKIMWCQEWSLGPPICKAMPSQLSSFTTRWPLGIQTEARNPHSRNLLNSTYRRNKLPGWSRTF